MSGELHIYRIKKKITHPNGDIEEYEEDYATPHRQEDHPQQTWYNHMISVIRNHLGLANDVAVAIRNVSYRGRRPGGPPPGGPRGPGPGRPPGGGNYGPGGPRRT